MYTHIKMRPFRRLRNRIIINEEGRHLVFVLRDNPTRQIGPPNRRQRNPVQHARNRTAGRQLQPQNLPVRQRTKSKAQQVRDLALQLAQANHMPRGKGVWKKLGRNKIARVAATIVGGNLDKFVTFAYYILTNLIEPF